MYQQLLHQGRFRYLLQVLNADRRLRVNTISKCILNSKQQTFIDQVENVSLRFIVELQFLIIQLLGNLQSRHGVRNKR